jgi:uncharacterized protein (DUF342 family)
VAADAPDSGAPEDLEDTDDVDLDELKELLAEEGAADEDDWSPEQVLADIEDEREKPSRLDPPSRRRAGGRPTQDRRAADEQAFRDLDSQLQASTLEVRVSDDHLTVSIGRLTGEDDLAAVRAELQRHKIVADVDEQTVAAALRRATAGRPQYDVVVARGTSASVTRPPGVRYHLPAALSAADPQPLAALREALAGPSLEIVEQWRGPVHVVHCGDVLIDIAPAEYETGTDVYGHTVEPDLGPPPTLPQGDNTTLREDGLAVVATLYGYAGLIGEDPTVVPPLFVSSDAMMASFIVVRGETMSAPTVEEMADILQARWIEHGVDARLVQKLCGELDSGRALDGRSHPIAFGRPACQGSDGRVDYAHPVQALARWGDLQGLLKAHDREELAEAVADLRGSGRQLLAVKKGEVLATRTPALDGKPGMDVRGEELPADDGEEVELQAGLNTDIDDEGLHLRASCFGLVAIYGDSQLSVVPPLWTAADRQSLCYLNLHQGEEPRIADADELADLIEADVDLSRWDALAAQLEAGELTVAVVPLIEGAEPQPGEDGRFEWAVEVRGRAGRILEDGSIDLRDRRIITVVQPGDLIGTAVPARSGTPGQDIYGAELAAPGVVEIEVVPDARIETRPAADGRVEYYAREEGGISFTEEVRNKRGGQTRRLKLSLFAVSEIAGDVDYSTGHIDFRGNVSIEGSVKPLFRVKASGSVTIGGNVEPGARIEAGGDIVVGGGVVGEKTLLQAGGGVQAKFVQQATVRCGADVEVGAYLIEASVRAGGNIVVAGAGGGSGRALVGGLAWAGGTIEVPSLGSPSNPHLHVVCGVDPRAVAEAEALRGKVRRCEARQATRLRELGLGQLDADALRRRLEKSSGALRDRLLAALKEVADCGLLRRDLRRRIDELVEGQRAAAARGRLTVSGPIFAGVDLRIGEHTMHIDEDAARLRYRLVEDDEGHVEIAVDKA